jgi:hypothetical protein
LGDYLYNEKYNQFNSVDRIKERREYLRKKREELEKIESSPRRKKSTSSWIESFIGGLSENTLSDNTMNEFYEQIVQQTGIPQSYFSRVLSDDCDDYGLSQNNSEPTEPETTEQ